MAYPVPPAPPTAVLVGWVRPSRLIRVFAGGWDAGAAAFKPSAIAATWAQWEGLMPETINLTHAAIVLARRPDQLLNEERRDRLWRAFRVPVFEQILDQRGAVLAAECEAHEGLHIESDKLEVLESWIDEAPCGCGRKSPRLRSPRREDPLRAIAAYAR